MVLQTMVVKLIFKAIMEKINEKHNLNKIDRYVNQDNELDIKVKSLEKKIKKLEKDSHPRADWICMDCGCKAKKAVKIKKKRGKK
tara:strand:+ start:2343 stop:2597 length:255 start_codon:yes stop_codon:yes gene_type:complete